MPLIAGPGPLRAQEDYPDGLPDWLFTVGGGLGMASRDVFGVSDGAVQTDNTSATNCDGDGICTLFDEDTRAVDGLGYSFNVQLMSPPWKDVWGKPRLLLGGGYGWPDSDRVVSEVGTDPDDFDTNGQEADVRFQLAGDPDSFWWVGGGFAVQLPIDRYPVWFKISVNYMEEETEVTGRVDQLTSIDQVTGDDIILTSEETEDLTVRHVTPAIGLEALFARIGPLALGLSGDFMVGVPLGSTDKTFVVEAPGFQSVFDPDAPFDGGPVTFFYDADDPWFWGGITLRLTWIGFDD